MSKPANLASCAVLAALAACSTPRAPLEPPSAGSVAAHVAAAKAAAGDDLTALFTLCRPASPTTMSPEEGEKYLRTQIDRPVPAPGQAFDNLYFVGAAWSTAWALKTSDGIILIDALNNRAEAEVVIEGGLRRLGLDPSQIKTVVVSHGHGDHYGGAPYLVEKYKARVVMSDLDWTMTETKLDFASPLWPGPPKRDVSVREGDTVVLGDTTVTIRLTPGHSVGTASTVFDVKDASGTHRVLTWGGTSFNFGRDLARLDAYIDSVQRTADLVAREKIDVLLSNHANFDGAVEKLQRRREAGAGAPNPFVMGTPNVLRALTVMGECARAQRDRYLL